MCAVLQVKYNERFTEELHLPVEKIAFGTGKPQPFTAEGPAAAWLPVARPVLQQDAHAAASQETFQVSMLAVNVLFR